MLKRLKEKNKQNYTKDNEHKEHKIFDIPTIGIEEIYQIVEELSEGNGLDKILKREQDKFELYKQNKNTVTDPTNEANECNRKLQNGESKIIANFIFFLA